MIPRLNAKAAAFLALLSLVAGALGAETVYYVDSSKGSDRASGKSPQKAWKSLAKVNAARLEPGDKVLLKRGAIFEGSLAPSGSGTKKAPLGLGAYGEGPKPVVKAPVDGSATAAISLFNQEYWTIEGLEVIGGNPRGISVSGNAPNGRIRGISILDCYVHGVGGESRIENDKDNGCIILSTGKSPGTQFEDVLIEGCEAADTRRWAGIMVFGAYERRGRSTNVTIRRSKAHHVYGDGIVLFCCADGLIEDCVAYEAGLDPVKDVGTANGIWCWCSDRVTIQRCEAYSIHSADIDGGGFDIDYSCRDCVIQYCYAHDCDAYGVSIFGAYDDFLAAPELATTSGAVVRFNVFANNCRKALTPTAGDFFLGTWNKGTIAGARIHNNLSFWNPNGQAPCLAAGAARLSAEDPCLFANNVVYSNVRAMVSVPEAGIALDRNCYHMAGTGMPTWTVGDRTFGSFALYSRTTGLDGESLVEDPLVLDPTYHGVGRSPDAFSLRGGSPCLGSGSGLDGMGEADFFGSPIGAGAPNIGPYGGPGIDRESARIPLSALRLDRASLRMKAGDAVSLRAFAEPDGASDPRVRWEADDESVVSVSINGTVTARGTGSTLVRAVAVDGGFEAACEVSVEKVTRILDELGDFSKVAEYTAGWMADGKDPEKWPNRDRDRICPFLGIGVDQSLTYKLPDIGNFTVRVGYCVFEIVHDPAKYRFRALVSKDGYTWLEVPVRSAVEDNGVWRLVSYSPAEKLPEGVAFLRLVFRDDEKGWTTELSSVLIVSRSDPEFGR